VLATVTAGRAWAGEEPPSPAPPAAGDDQALAQAKQHFEAGKAAFQARDFPAAIREFKAAAALRPSPILDYNIGLANEQLGKPKVAAKYFRRYLAARPDAENRAEVEAKIAAADQSAQQPASTSQAQQANEDVGAPPAPVGQQPQYQGQGQGSDPYAGYQPPPPTGGPTYTTKPPKKKSYWWVVFPVLGGVTLLTIIIVAYVLAYQAATNVTYPALNALPTSPSLGNSIAGDRETGVLFRF
jgi:tetratricopeptide (TPR) repeat protein